MKTAVIDSTADKLALAIVNDGTVYRYVSEAGSRRHTSAILTELDKLFTESGLTPDMLDYIGVVVGPGSFTGIRIGVATANAMSMATGAKLVEITALEALVYGESKALALIDCKHGNYYALYKDGDALEYKAIDSAEAEAYDGVKVLYAEPDIDALIKVTEHKIALNATVKTAKPFYIKQSSAETESGK